MLHRLVCLVVAALAIGAALPPVAAAGPLQACCSSKNAFCIMPYVGGAAGCAADGGMLANSNACTSTRECGNVHQRKATGTVTVQPPASPPRNINLNGTIDVIETEMIQLDLKGIDPISAQPVRLRQQLGKASTGTFTPNVDSFFDIWVELALPVPQDAMVAQNPIHIAAAPVGPTFPVEMVPYNSSGGSPTVDRAGAPNGAILSVSITVLPYPDADGDGVEDAEDACPGTPPATSVNHIGCSDAQLCGPDDDGDGKVNAMDDCPGTAPAAAIDDSGCSLDQFCATQDATTAMGKGICTKLDWQNDEPKQLPRNSDCIVNKMGPGMLDDVCVPRP